MELDSQTAVVVVRRRGARAAASGGGRSMKQRLAADQAPRKSLINLV